ncbi:MAG TPA: glutamine-synthetase adenylyltransferase, partial [Hypericibacter adhaerens]|nr:glutamine-synthetase adenylyltransferase [Hypericibacter adhaerens]
MPVSLDDLLVSSPYLRDLHARHGGWLAGALPDPPQALEDVLREVAAAGANTGNEEALGACLREAKARMALLCAAAETGRRWTTAEACAALSDFADAALDAALAVLLRRAVDKGDLVGSVTPQRSGLAIFALGKQGGRELNYSSDIDIVAFFDRDAGVLADPLEATKVYSRIVQRLAALLQDRVGNDYVFRIDLRLRP